VGADEKEEISSFCIADNLIRSGGESRSKVGGKLLHGRVCASLATTEPEMRAGDEIKQPGWLSGALVDYGHWDSVRGKSRLSG
jgi:hypothetical protein